MSNKTATGLASAVDGWRAGALAECRATVGARPPWFLSSDIEVWVVCTQDGPVKASGAAIVFDSRDAALDFAARHEFDAEYVDPAVIPSATVQRAWIRIE